jgi:hypothetical protein
MGWKTCNQKASVGQILYGAGRDENQKRVGINTALCTLSADDTYGMITE